MNLIFGGAYQGKLDYAKKAFHCQEEDVFHCISTNPKADFTKKIIDKTEDLVLACVRNEMDAKDYFEKNKRLWQNAVIICCDISQGIVPMEREYREWREMTGRLLTYLGEEAETVVRIFCGLPQEVKG
ncbi:MAG: bifunctional adenosylcobinamide kinase/adenosylcobinamide-phosphate guanylyltransferase [Anaerovorax sp.]